MRQETDMTFKGWENPVGTDGFEFIEYTAPDPVALGKLFEQMGFTAIARHRHKNVTLYRQGEINFIINAEPDSFAQRFARLHGPSICAIAFRVADAGKAYQRALELGAWGFDNKTGPMELNIPAIKGIGDSLIYFVDRWRGKNGAQPGAIGDISIYDVDFEPIAGAHALGPLQRRAVEERPVAGAEILHPPAAVAANQPGVLARHRAARDDESSFAVATHDVLRQEQRNPASDIRTRRMEIDQARVSRRRLCLRQCQRPLQDQRPSLAIFVRHVPDRYSLECTEWANPSC